MDDTYWRDADDAILPKYNRPVVAQAILEAAVELHPKLLTARELSLRIIADPKDRREVETARQAIDDLKQSGLFADRDDDEVAEPTAAALHAVALLT
jgi:radical SAM superfamily enzyme YgiQ (UPF0313 family)